MKKTINSLIVIILLSLIALFLKRKVNTPNIELESINDPELTVVATPDDVDEINENDMK